jgi:hypothetical protein
MSRSSQTHQTPDFLASSRSHWLLTRSTNLWQREMERVRQSPLVAWYSYSHEQPNKHSLCFAPKTDIHLPPSWLQSYCNTCQSQDNRHGCAGTSRLVNEGTMCILRITRNPWVEQETKHLYSTQTDEWIVGIGHIFMTQLTATVEPFLPCPPLCMTISDFNITNKIATMVPITMTMLRGISVFGI